MHLVIDGRSLAEAQVTGVGQYLLTFLENFQPLSFPAISKATVLTAGSKPVHPALADSVSRNSLHHVHVPTPSKIINTAMMTSIGFDMATMVPGSDYVWLPNINFLNTRSAVPYAVTVHDFSFLHNPGLYSVKRRLWHRSIRIGRLLRNAEKIIAVSHNTKDDLVHFFPDLSRKPIRVIYPLLPNNGGLQAVNGNADIPSVPEKYILYLGTLEPRKNIAAVIQAFKAIQDSHPDLHLVLAGAFGWSVGKLLPLLATDDHIHWLRYVHEKQKQYLLTHAQALLWPSLYEGYGFPPLEALRVNTPVITSYRSSLPEVLKEKAFYVNPYNYGELAVVLRSILGTKKLVQNRNSSSLHTTDGRQWVSTMINFFTE